MTNINASSPVDPSASSRRKPLAIVQMAFGVGLLIACFFLITAARDVGSKTAAKAEDTGITIEAGKKDPTPASEGFGVRVGDRFFAGTFAGLLGIGLITLGGWTYTRQLPNIQEEQTTTRGSLMVAGVLSGLCIFLCGLCLFYWWSESLTAWLEQGKRKESKWVLYSLSTLVAGLIVIFFSLQPARREVRNSPSIRRLYFGFNTLLAGLFLVVLLFSLNIYTSTKWKSFVDTTESSLFSLQPKSKELIAGLTEPVNATLILPPGTPFFSDLETLLKNCEALNGNFKFQTLDPTLDLGKVLKLHDKLKTPQDSRDQLGMILAMGEDQSKAIFLNINELVEQKRGPRGSPEESGEALIFNGEGRLMLELNYLAEGAIKPKIYFLQGNGELEVGYVPEPGKKNDTPPERSAGVLERYLKDRKYDVLPLKLDFGKTIDIDPKAAAIVLLSPTRPYNEATVKFLSEYIKPSDPKRLPGKLIAVLPPTKTLDGKLIEKTELEPIFANYGVDIMQERIVHLATRGEPFETSIGQMGPDASGNKLELVTPERGLYPTSRVLRVNPATPTSVAKKLVETSPQVLTWIEKGFDSNYDAIVQRMKDDSRVAESKRAGSNKFPLVLAISDVPPTQPGMQPPAESESKPRMVLFAYEAFNDKLVRNPGMIGIQSQFEFFGGMVDWLREREAIVGIEAKEQRLFEPPSGVSLLRLFLMPMMLMLMLIVGVGLSVWIVRRK
jgi:hypothetical protein